jgi:predicted alpha/beta superfamily hydrolase
MISRMLGLVLLAGCAAGRGSAPAPEAGADSAAALAEADDVCRRTAAVTVHVQNQGSPDVEITFGSYRVRRAAQGLSRTTYAIPRSYLTGDIRLSIARGGLQVGPPARIQSEPVICNDATLIIGPDLNHSYFYGQELQTPTRQSTATIRVLVPEGTGSVYLAGSLPELGPWRPDARIMAGEGRERVTRFTAPTGTSLEYKFTLGSWDREALGADGKVPANHRLLLAGQVEARHEVTAFKAGNGQYIVDWEGSGVEGRLVYWTDVASAHLGPTRHVEVWLPPGYDETGDTRYAVLYMHDGQNLFDPRIASTGTDWGVDDAVVRLVRQGGIRPVIVVGVWSTNDRGVEYSPWHDAPDYARFLIEELMPRVNAEFRTLTGPENTAVMGSSLGGLLSFYLVTRHPEAFGACGCVSTHFPLSEKMVAQYFAGVPTSETPDSVPYVLRDIEAGRTVPGGTRYWFDYGTLGLDSTYGPTHDAVRAWLLRQGLVEGEDFVVRRYEGADHNEASWRARLDDPLTFLFGRPRR